MLAGIRPTVGENIYGLHFHLEVMPEMIADWCGKMPTAAM
jgi:hypothetical protein